jgi:hypothetical protein
MYSFNSSLCLTLPEQTAQSAQKPGEFGQFAGKMFMQSSCYRQFGWQQTTEALRAFHKAEIDKWWPIIKASNI